MYLARITGSKLFVYPLIGQHRPVVWRFWSYECGAAAKDKTKTSAIAKARLELTQRSKPISRPRMQKLDYFSQLGRNQSNRE